MRIVVSGSSGLVGSVLLPALGAVGHQVVKLVRVGASSASSPGRNDIAWDPLCERIDAGRLEGVDAVVHLAGENISAGRWTAARKEKIRKSRVNGTQLLSETLTKLKRPPRVLVSASAIGFYGDRGDEVLREASPPGHGFLPAVCVGWESATERAEKHGLRVVHLRFGIILSARGGALGKMLIPFRLGLGGPVGSGRQYWSWVAIDDAVGAIQHALAKEDMRGPVNVVAPQPATNLEFTRTLARALRRPAIFPLPVFAARLLLGEMADALLLASVRVVPEALKASGYRFRYPDLEPALRHLLGR
jgi:uncharacterized protein (TIGR01777 family)